MTEAQDFSLRFDYSTEKDTIQVTADKKLTREDIILVLTNLLSLFELDERELASRIALDVVNTVRN